MRQDFGAPFFFSKKRWNEGALERLPTKNNKELIAFRSAGTLKGMGKSIWTGFYEYGDASLTYRNALSREMKMLFNRLFYSVQRFGL